MKVSLEDIAALEWQNYAAAQPMVAVTPGVELTLRDDVILTSSQVFPTPDANHACLLRATRETAPALITEVVEYFTSMELPPTIFVSPACTPENLPDLLVAQGFVRQKEQEAWMVLEQGDDLVRSAPSARVEVHSIDKCEAMTFASVFVKAFGMPEEYAAPMAEVVVPSIGLPGMFHYVATFDGQPLGVCTLICHEELAIFGSVGIIPSLRGLKVLSGLIAHAYTDAYAWGFKRALIQTTAGGLLERFARITGLKTYFTRTCYTLA
jgi:GNAT superfamily N-acetyltransferase